MNDSSFTYDYKKQPPLTPIEEGPDESWELSYLVKGAEMVGQEASEAKPMISGDVMLFPPHLTHNWTFNCQIVNEAGDVEFIRLFFPVSFLDRLVQNFPEYQGIMARLQQYTCPIRYNSLQASQIIEELEIMRDLTNIERIPHVMHLLSLL